MRRMTVVRQMIGLDGIGEAVEMERFGVQGPIFRDGLDTERCRSIVFRGA
jgi:hypothetical protein